MSADRTPLTPAIIAWLAPRKRLTQRLMVGVETLTQAEASRQEAPASIARMI